MINHVEREEMMSSARAAEHGSSNHASRSASTPLSRSVTLSKIPALRPDFCSWKLGTTRITPKIVGGWELVDAIQPGRSADLGRREPVSRDVVGRDERRDAFSRAALQRPGGGVFDPIEASLRIADGLLRVQAIALHAAGDLDPWMLLWWNRQTRLVRFGCTRSQDIWVHADIPVSDAHEHGVDRLLGLIAEAVIAVRGHAAGVR